MVINHRGRARKKESGGKYRPTRGKRLFMKGAHATLTVIDETHKCKIVRTKANGRKSRVLTAAHVNLFDPKTKKFAQAKLKTVTDCPADDHYIRRNIFVKGAVVETDKGKARITSRPGQNGSINAVLI